MGGITITMKLVVSLAILALAASQTPAIDIDEVVPESVADDFLVQSFAQAKTALANNGEGQCQQLADETEQAVKDAVKAQQDIIDAMDNGGSCHTAGDNIVNDAQNTLDQAKHAEQTAKNAKEAAESQMIDLGSFSFKQLESIVSSNTCNNDIIMASSYTGAVAGVQASRNAHESAKDDVTSAETALENAKEEGAKLVNQCMCHVIQEHDAAVGSANDAMEEANLKAWTQAAHIRCVVAGTALPNCQVGNPPVVVPAQLADGVACNNGLAQEWGGVKKNIAKSVVTGAGFTLCYSFPMNQRYDNNEAALKSGCTGEHMVMACGPTNGNTLKMAAAGNTAEILHSDNFSKNQKPTSELQHQRDGVGWFNSKGSSRGCVGFTTRSPSQLVLSNCDGAMGQDQSQAGMQLHYRHAGYRCGTHNNNGYTAYFYNKN